MVRRKRRRKIASEETLGGRFDYHVLIGGVRVCAYLRASLFSDEPATKRILISPIQEDHC